ncbi:hypothetical protein ACQPZF_05280 [Actinosynnema sp. CS-041913]|uniref:hypothetical protein n=1 Tax=Actinosynnema sp. CS-041913 TaxID=3239917 RepID=UPI003D8D36AA
MDESLIQDMVTGSAPRMFAVVEEDEDETWVAAWGLVLEEHTEVISVDGDLRMSLQEPEGALDIFNAVDNIARLVWV